MGEPKRFHDIQNSVTSRQTLHEDLAQKRRIYRQMDKLVHDLQGVVSDGFLASDEDDDGDNNGHNVFRHLAARKNSMSFSLRPAMSEAIARGDSKLLRRLTSLCVKIPHRGQGHSWTKASLSGAMAEAIDAKRTDLMDILLEGKANASGSHQGQCHLARAIRTGNDDMVKRLIEAGADVNDEVDNKTVLHIAASMSSADVIQRLLDNGSRLETIDSIQGNTALHIACSYCNAAAAGVLIRNGAEFNCRNFQGDTPLAKLLRHITKNKQDWHNSKSLDLAKALVGKGLMIFSSDDSTTGMDKRKRSRKSKENRDHLSFTPPPPPPPLLSSDIIPPLSNSSSQIPMCSARNNSRTRDPNKLYLPGSPHEMFTSLVKSLEDFDEDRENMAEFPVLSSSPSSSSLASSSSSSLSSCESSFSLTEEPEIVSTTSSPERSRPCPWWKKKETKMFQLYDKLVSESSVGWSLQQHCRLRVLHCLATRSVKSSVTTLGLPRMVQRYLIYGPLASFNTGP